MHLLFLKILGTSAIVVVSFNIYLILSRISDYKPDDWREKILLFTFKAVLIISWAGGAIAMMGPMWGK